MPYTLAGMAKPQQAYSLSSGTRASIGPVYPIAGEISLDRILREQLQSWYHLGFQSLQRWSWQTVDILPVEILGTEAVPELGDGAAVARQYSFVGGEQGFSADFPHLLMDSANSASMFMRGTARIPAKFSLPSGHQTRHDHHYHPGRMGGIWLDRQTRRMLRS